jgi:hypothetical protein
MVHEDYGEGTMGRQERERTFESKKYRKLHPYVKII